MNPNESKPLYEDNKIKIGYFQNSAEDHTMIIKESNMQFILQRGVLEELSKTSRDRLIDKLSAIDPMFPHLLDERKISQDYLQIVLAQAHINEINQYVESLEISKNR
ncbi:MAG: hypothetical protein KJ697_02840 [Nanoarchaeota archaeon]|nr:hypothetical protein [Nanoarchaeota archaeon]MBU4124087.1 hypothetical protein [Nanoarchaeota archaeon]